MEKKYLDIDLLVIVKYLIRHCYVIIVLGLLIGIFMGVRQGRIDAANAVTTAQSNGQVSIQSIEESIEPNEVKMGYGYYNITNDYQDYIGYVGQSKLYSLDAKAVAENVSMYTITADDSAQAKALVESFLSDGIRSYLNDDEAGLVAITESESDSILSVKVMNDSEESAVELAARVEAALNEFAADLNPSISISLTKVYDSTATVCDEDLAELQADMVDDAELLSEDYYKITDYFRGSPLVLYNALLNRDDGYEYTQDFTETQASSFSINKKYTLLGGIVGAGLGVLILLFLYTFKPAVHTVNELTAITGKRCIGRMSEKEAQLTMASLVVYCKDRNLSKIALTTTLKQELAAETVMRLTDKLKENGIEAFFCENVMADSDAFIKASDCGSLALIEKLDATRIKSLSALAESANGNNIELAGTILI